MCDLEKMSNISESIGYFNKRINDFILEIELCLEEHKKMKALAAEFNSWNLDDKKEILLMLGLYDVSDNHGPFVEWSDDSIDAFLCPTVRSFFSQIQKGVIPLIRNKRLMNALLEKIKTAKRDFAHYDAWFKQHAEIAKKHELLLKLYRSDFEDFIQKPYVQTLLMKFEMTQKEIAAIVSIESVPLD